jgi:DNA-binding response OmpR family regulator
VAVSRLSPEAATVSYSNTPVASHVPILVVDANSLGAGQLAGKLEHCGFAAHTAITCPAALAALRARYYGAIVFAGDPGNPADLLCIAALRRRVPRTWLVMVSSSMPHDSRELVLRYGVDVLLVAPFSIEDLASRLSAFSLRSRPP